MGVAYSDRDPVFSEFLPGDTKAALLAAIHELAVFQRWPYAAISGGYKYSLISPQGLACKLKIWDGGYTANGEAGIYVQFISYDEARSGVAHPIVAAGTRIYEAVLGECQFFLGTVGSSSTKPDGSPNWANSACGGVPYVPEASGYCFDEPVTFGPVTEAWWSSGSGNQTTALWGAGGGYGFRQGWRNDYAWDGCWNESLQKAYLDNGVDSGAALRLGVVTHPLRDFDTGQQTRWLDGSALYYEPFLLWGDGKGLPCRVRGQIWDAVAGSIDAGLGVEVVSEESSQSGPKFGVFTWRNYMHYQGSMSGYGGKGSYYSSLYLLKGLEPTEGSPLISNAVY